MDTVTETRPTAGEILERFVRTRQPAIATLNGFPIALDLDKGTLTFRFESTVAMCHSTQIPQGGIVQGGFVAGWLDTSMAHLAIALTNFAMRLPTLELKVSYLAPAHPGRVYFSEATMVRRGRTVAFLEARLRDEEGKLIATASSTGMFSPIPPGAEA